MLASLVLLFTGVVFAAPADAATVMYPDLQTLAPRDLRFGTATINGTSHRVLQFSNTVVNVGEGRLDIVGIIDPTTRNGPAYQHVYDDAGNYTEYPAGSLMWHDIHKHFHYDNWGRYELWPKADYDKWLSTGRSQGQAKKVGSKTTSCILDEEFIKESPGAPYPGGYSGSGCDLQPDNTLHEGLSPGWGDTYDWYRDEQWIDLDQTPLADGTYVLRSVTDPTNMLYESPGKADSARESQENNEATTTFTVAGGVIQDSTPPSGTITVNSTAASTTDPNVTVSAIGRDDVSGVDKFRLSNDGVTWREFTLTSGGSVPTNVPWNLTDAAYGGNSATGVKQVFAQFHDASGKWGATITDTIDYSATAPPPPPSESGYAATVVADGPVGYWRLGEPSGTSAADAVGTHTGTYAGGPTLGQPSLVSKESDPSVRLTGSSSVRIANATDLQIGTPLSMEAWIKPTALPASGAYASVLSKPESYSLQFNGSQLEFTVIQNGQRKRLKAPAGSIAVGQTYHVVGSYDGSTQRLYLNGKMVTSTALTGAATSTTSQLTIGSWDGGGEFFSGQVDDVALYAKALSATQVGNHYTAATGGPAPTTQTVSVTTTGTGTGTVVSSPSGISCPSTCSMTVPSGSTVTLTATPASGSTFGGWTAGACTGTSTTCTFNAYAATSATVSFTNSSPPPPPPAGTGYAATVTADGPVSYWRLGETSGTTAADATGNHAGTFTNGPTLGQPSLLTSDTNPSVSFDGVNDDLRVPDATDLQFATSFSLETWIRPTSLPATGAFASVLSKAESYSLQFNGPRLEFTIIQSGVRKRLQAPAGAVAAGQTYHVVATYDGTTQRLYLNGAQVTSSALTGAASATTNQLTIGSWSGGEFLAGRIDEVAAYAKTLSSTQVKAHYSAGTTAG
jgi:hypothetical protein